jgi:hypothetical protein
MSATCTTVNLAGTEVGQALDLLEQSVKQAAASPGVSYGMVGELQYSKSGWLLLHVPNDIVRGAFAALNEPGVELPYYEGRLDAHISVMSPEDIATVEGGADAITERGRDFSYTLGPVRSAVPGGWPGVSRVWFVEVRSPSLKKLRKSYGLTALPHDGEYQFHITVAVRKKGVLSNSPASKAASLIHHGDVGAFFKDAKVHPLRPVNEDAFWDSPPNKEGRRCPGCNQLFKEVEPLAGVENCERCERYGPPKEAAVSTKQMIATERLKVEEPASQAQAEAGNYRKGHIKLHGLDISIENGKGSTRSGTSPDGKKWSIVLKCEYGYIKRTKGADGDHVDCFIGPNPDGDTVFIVNQVDPGTQKFDEHKVLLGFLTEAEARKGYLANYETGWKGLGSLKQMTLDEFKEWLDGDTTKRAARDGTYPGVSNLVLDEDEVLHAQRFQLCEIRRSRNHGLRKLAKFFPSLLPGHGPVSSGSHVGANQQQRQLQSAQLPLGDSGRTGMQSEKQSAAFISRSPDVSDRMGRGNGTEAGYRTHAPCERVERTRRVDDAGRCREEKTSGAAVCNVPWQLAVSLGMGAKTGADCSLFDASVEPRVVSTPCSNYADATTLDSLEDLIKYANTDDSGADKYKSAIPVNEGIRKRAGDEERPPVVAVDLDGTVLEYDGWVGESHFGDPRPGARKALKALQGRGYLLVINTCRGNVQAVKDVLHENDLPYDYVNESPHQPPGTSDKIQADVYIDDRAVNARQPWSKITKETVRRVKAADQNSFYLAAIPGTPVTVDPNQGAVQNLVRQLGAVRQRGDQAIREAYGQEDLANAADPSRPIRQFSSYLAGQRGPTVHHWLDRVLQGDS